VKEVLQIPSIWVQIAEILEIFAQTPNHSVTRYQKWETLKQKS
jgi:hypothetical protein